MKKVFFLICVLLAAAFTTNAQQSITLEDIWQDYRFLPNTVPGFRFLSDGQHYSRQQNRQVERYNILSGDMTATIFEAMDVDFSDYQFSTDESKVLIESGREKIYRRSYRAAYYVYDRSTDELKAVFPDAKVRYATFNPQADKVAFVHQNNLYYQDLNTGEYHQVTEDGEPNAIINGGTDWVYEEEFGFSVGFQWSPDGQRLAFYRFDEREVEEFTMTNYRDDLYPEYVTFKYPKVGMENSDVRIHIHDLNSGRTVAADTWVEEDHYLPRIHWTTSSDKLCIMRMNRHQNRVELLLSDAATGKVKTLLEEENPYYISESLLDDLTFLADGKHFVWGSERSGWRHLYLYDMQGELVRPLTQGKWDVTDFYGVDEPRQQFYYQAAKSSPLQREVYAGELFKDRERKLSKEIGWNEAQFSSTFDYYVMEHATANQPSIYTVYDRSGKAVRVIEDNRELKARQRLYGVNPIEFFTFETSEGVSLNGYMIKPDNFDPKKQYPVFMYLYGGPGSQQVTDNWKGQNYWWFQMLADQGYLIACVDNRGTGARGQEFKKMTYLQLGHYETIDQIEAARYLGNLPYTDASRIGIFGWSYGGYMSSLCLLKGNDVFKAAIAVAPVTNWKWYDTIYTERFMRTLEENPDGYRNNSPVYFADRLRGNYLLVHGMGDDNVHFQHTAEMVNALVAANKQFDTYFYPNLAHSISGGPARLHLYTKMTQFLEDKLKGKEESFLKRAPMRTLPIEEN